MFWKFIYNDFVQNKFKNILVIFTFFIVMFFSISIFILDKNLNQFIFDQTWISERLKNPNMLEVMPKSWTLEAILLDREDDSNDEIISLENDDRVHKIYYFYNTRFPNSLWINLFWTEIKTDFLMYIASDELFTKSSFKNDDIPLWISKKLLDLYNFELSNNSLFPRITESQLSLLKFDLKFNHSNIFNIKGNDYSWAWRINTVDNNFPLLWLTIPYSKAKKIFENIWEKKINIHKSLVFLKDKNMINSFVQDYPNLNIKTLESEKENITNKLFVIKAFMFFVLSVVVFVLISFMFFLTHSIVFDNKNIFKILISHGASSLFIFWIIYFKIFFSFLVAFIILLIYVYILNNLVFIYISKYIYNNYSLTIDFVPISYLNILILFLSFSIFITILVFLISRKSIFMKYLN